jgi:uncharacterized membrane protein YgcG
VAQIYQIAVVGKDLADAVAQPLALGPENGDSPGRERRGMPLALIFCEQGKGSGPDLAGATGGVLHPTRRADVCSDIFHCRNVLAFVESKDRIFYYFCEIMRTRLTFFCAAVMVATIASTWKANGQFSMNSIGRGADPTVAIPMNANEIDADVINKTHARLLRKQRWHAANAVDYKASLTGMVTQFSKSWTTNNQNAVSGELAAYYYHTHTRDRFISTFKFDGIYGMNFIDDSWFKNQDYMKLYYLMSWKMSNKGLLRNWAYSFESSFASQFAEGYKSRTEHDLWSNFMAPGILTAGIGVTYTSPSKKLPFIVTLNPASLNGLFVVDNGISDDRRKQLGINNPRLANGRPNNYKIEGGSSINIGFDRTFAFGGGGGNSDGGGRSSWWGGGQGLTLQYKTTLNSFYGWITQELRRGPIDGTPAPPDIMPTVRWDNSLVFNPLKFLSMEFRTTTIYDRSQVDKVQMQYYLRVGLTYRYKNR